MQQPPRRFWKFSIGVLVIAASFALIWSYAASPHSRQKLSGSSRVPSVARPVRPEAPKSGPVTPSISWIPAHLVVTLTPGDTKTAIVTATIALPPGSAATILTQSSPESFSPSLQPYASVSPTLLPPIVPTTVSGAAAVSQAFTLTFTVPSGTPYGTIEGDLEFHPASNVTPNTPRLPSTALPITLNLWPSVVAQVGPTLDYPPDWIVSNREDELTLTDNTDRSSFNPFTGVDFVSFHVRSLSKLPPAQDANPHMLPIGQWFTEYFSQGFPSAPSTTTVQVAGRTAIRMGIAEGDGPHTYVFIPNGVDVIEVSFRSISPFDGDYETVLSTMAF